MEAVVKDKMKEGLQKLQNILQKNKRNKTESIEPKVVEEPIVFEKPSAVVEEEQQAAVVVEPEAENKAKAIEQMKVEPIIINLNGQQDIQGILNSIFSGSQLSLETEEEM